MLFFSKMGIKAASWAPGKIIMEALALMTPPQTHYGHFVKWGNKRLVIATLMFKWRLLHNGCCRERKSGHKRHPKTAQSMTVSFLCTYSNIVNGHPHRPMVIDLLCGDRLGLISQKNAQQQQQTLVSINHTCRKRESCERMQLPRNSSEQDMYVQTNVLNVGTSI